MLLIPDAAFSGMKSSCAEVSTKVAFFFIISLNKFVLIMQNYSMF